MVCLASGIWDSAHGIFITKNEDFCLYTAGYTLFRVVPFAFYVEKVRRLEKSTPAPLVTLVTNYSYDMVGLIFACPPLTTFAKRCELLKVFHHSKPSV